MGIAVDVAVGKRVGTCKVNCAGMGSCNGPFDGSLVRFREGRGVGFGVSGRGVGLGVARDVVDSVGNAVGGSVGDPVGSLVGSFVGIRVEAEVGDMAGAGLRGSVGEPLGSGGDVGPSLARHGRIHAMAKSAMMEKRRIAFLPCRAFIFSWMLLHWMLRTLGEGRIFLDRTVRLKNDRGWSSPMQIVSIVLWLVLRVCP